VLQDRQSFCSDGGAFSVTELFRDSDIVTIAGEGALTYTLRLGTRTDLPRGSAEFEFGYHGISGTLTRGATFKVTASCDTPRGASCLVSEPSLTDTVPDGETRVDDWNLEARHLGPRDRITEFFELSLTASRDPRSVPLLAGRLVENATPRCDTIITRRGGCVFPDYKPTLTYSLSDPRVTFTAMHIQRAEAAGQPGAPGGRALTRTMNRTKINRNRYLACGNFKKTTPNGSCDEYPFASTEQGQAFTGLKASTEQVPLPDNVAAGRDLGVFYLVNRVIRGDPFYVGIVP
jgi:hypothetical protein